MNHLGYALGDDDRECESNISLANANFLSVFCSNEITFK